MRNDEVAPMHHTQTASISAQVQTTTLTKAAVPTNATYDSASTTTTQLCATTTNITTTLKTTTPAANKPEAVLYRTHTNPSR